MSELNKQKILANLSRRANVWLDELYVFASVDSTNAELKRLAQLGSIAGKMAVTDCQTQGRGRRGRTWITPAGQAIAMSLGVCSQMTPVQSSGLSLVVGLAIVDALESMGFHGAGLKWPNDLMVGDAKLAGILVESTPVPSGLSLVIGIGLNIQGRSGISAEIQRNIADLSQLKSDLVDRNALIAAITGNVLVFIDEFECGGFEPMRDQWQERHVFQQKEVIVLQGKEETRGLVVGVSEVGELLLGTSEGVKSFSAGEVSLTAS